MFIRIVFLAGAITALADSTAAAQTTPASEAAQQAAALAPFIDAETLLVARIDLTAFDAKAVAAKLVEVLPLPPAYFDKTGLPGEVEAAVAQLTKAGVRDLVAVVSVADLPRSFGFLVVPLAKGAQAAAILEALRPRCEVVERRGEAVVGGSRAVLDRLAAGQPAPRPELAAALAATGGTAQVVFMPSPDARRVIEEIMPQLPAEVGGGPTRVLTQGIVWAAVGIDLPPRKFAARVVVQSLSAAAASDLSRSVADIHRALGELSQVKQAIPNFPQLAKVLALRVSGDRLTAELTEENSGVAALAQVVRPPVEAARSASARARSMNNLKQLALAMHNYVDKKKTFPPRTIVSPDGKPLLSWRVAILPYLDFAGAKDLYGQFKLDEPWDSEHNRALIARMPEVYRDPIVEAPAGKTTYVAPIIEGGMFGGPEPVAPKHVTDGLSNTVMVVETDAEHAVEWTRPDDIHIDVENPAQGLGDKSQGGFLTAFADGSARFVSFAVDKKTLLALLTARGGEVLQLPQ